MNNIFKYYVWVWVTIFAVYNICVFAVPEGVFGLTRSTSAFSWGYAFASIAFIGQLFCSYRAFKVENARKFFLRLPLINLSWTALVLCVLISFVGLFVKKIPDYSVIIANALVLGFYIVAIFEAEAAVDVVEVVERKIAEKTSFMKELTLLSQNLKTLANADNEALANEVYDEIRYSDPMSDPKLEQIEDDLKLKLMDFSKAITSNENDAAKELANKVITLTKQRNAICVSLKS